MTADLKEISKKILNESYDRESHFFSEYAVRSREGIGKREFDRGDAEEGAENFRLPFAHDIDRIIHSKAYARYQDKTQVFSQVESDHITRRIHHVQMVTRIARTIGRALRLNEDLIEAIALGHDVGHAPFGHTGEKALALILEEKGKGTFLHNVQSVRLLRRLENKGKGLNLTLQTLDGILGHNGEIESCEYTYDPQNLNWERLNSNQENCLNFSCQEKPDTKVGPSTLEGCVVRVSDIISYLGKDLEDAESLGIVNKEDLPSLVSSVLGSTNKEIINTLTEDIVRNSSGGNKIRFSEGVYRAFTELKHFNEEKIYHSPFLKRQSDRCIGMIQWFFENCLKDLKEGVENAPIFTYFLKGFDRDYVESESPERITADYIAGMTDDYFINCCKDEIMPCQFRYSENRKFKE